MLSPTRFSSRFLATLGAVSVLALASGSVAQASEVSSIEQSSASYRVSPDQLGDGEVQYFFKVVDARDGDSSDGDFRRVKGLDRENVWGNRGGEEYYVLITKTAFLADREASTFTEGFENDLGFVRQSEAVPGLSRTGGNSYHSPGNPDLAIASSDIVIEHYDAAALATAPDNVKALAGLDAALGQPTSLTLKTNSNFGTIRVIGSNQRTSKASFLARAYYKHSDSSTLVVSYSMTYIYQVPPFFAGGIGRLNRGTLDLIGESVDAIRTYGR